MSLDSLSKRLARAEARRPERIAGICNLAGHPPEIVADAMRNWRAWIANGRARRCGATLMLSVPAMTAAEWSARWSPDPRSAP